jgi:methionine aminotransferase
VVFSVNSLVQHALARYLESDDSYRHLSQFYRHKRDLFVTAMAGSRFRIHPAASTYFQLADYSAIQDEGDRDFCLRLIREYGVGAIPLSSFYHSTPNLRMVRFCFAKTEEMLQEAAQRLSQC